MILWYCDFAILYLILWYFAILYLIFDIVIFNIVIFDIVAQKLRLSTFHRLVTSGYIGNFVLEYITTLDNNWGRLTCMKDFGNISNVFSGNISNVFRGNICNVFRGNICNVFSGNISNVNLGRASAGKLDAFIAPSIFIVAIVASGGGKLSLVIRWNKQQV